MENEVSATELRRNIYKLLDQVIESGRPLTVHRKGCKLLIGPLRPASRLARLEPHPDCIIGAPQDLVEIDWSTEWKPCP
jgi:hypothetical protein